RVAEVVGAGGVVDAVGSPLTRIFVVHIMDLIAADVGVVVGRAKFDSGDIGANCGGEEAKDLVLRNDRRQGTDQLDSTEDHAVRVTPDRVVIDVEAPVNAI